MSTAKSWTLTWAANILECIPNVDIHGFHVRTEDQFVHNPATGKIDQMPGVTLVIEPAGLTAARLLAEALGLMEADPVDVADCLGLLTRHDWTGLVPAGADETPVWVEMSTHERIWTVTEAAA